MIFICPNCNSKFKSEVGGVVLCPSCNKETRVDCPVLQGSAWDRAQKGERITAFIDSVRLSIVNPVQFFEEVGAGAGWLRPFLYTLIISGIVFLAAFGYQAGFQLLAAGASLGNPFSISVFFLILLGIVSVPVATVVATLIQTLLYHICLIILGSAKRDLEATFRVICYASGPQLFNIVPFLGTVVGPLWQLVLGIVGIKVVHKTSYARSAVAAFLPTFFCCGIILLGLVAVAGGVTAGILKSMVH